MTKLGPEYVGKLAPGAAEMLERSLREYRDAATRGIVTGIRILSGPGCAVSEAQEGVVYPVHSVPGLPLRGCARAPCCACCYCPIVLGLPFKTVVVSGVVIQNDIGEDRLLVKLPSHFASTEEELLAAAKRLQPIMSLPFLVVAQQTDGSWISAMDTRCTDIAIPAWLDALDWDDIEVQWHERPKA